MSTLLAAITTRTDPVGHVQRKQFDVPFLTARTVANGLGPTRVTITNMYPYGHDSHADLMRLCSNSNYSLAGLCGFLNMETPTV